VQHLATHLVKHLVQHLATHLVKHLVQHLASHQGLLPGEVVLEGELGAGLVRVGVERDGEGELVEGFVGVDLEGDGEL
jgi:hypothetical protein